MAEFFFDLQRFVTVADGTVTLPKDDIDFTLDGVNYVPNVNGAVLKAETTKNEDGTYTATAITGITSGTVTAFPAGSSTDPGIGFVGETAFDFTCTGDDDGVLNVKYRNSSINYKSGNLTYTASELMMPRGKLGLTGTLANMFPYNVELTIPSDGATLKFGTDGATFTAPEAVGAKLTFDENIAPLLAALDKSVLVALAAAAGITLTEEQVESTLKIAIPFFQSGLSLDLTGEITYNTEEKTVLFAKDTTTNLYFGDRTISFTTNADAGTTFAYEDGALTITPNDGDGSLDVTIKNGDTTTFAGNVEIAGGSLVFDLSGSKVSVTAGTTMTISAPGISFGKRSFVVTADDETGFDLELDETGNKLTLTSADENPLKIKLTNGSATTFEREITFTGSVVIGMDDNSFTVTQGTALTFYSEVGDTEYTTTITATSEAGIGLELVDGKFTITPGEDDGSLNLIHQRGDTTVFDLDLSVSGGSMTIDPSSGAFTVAEGTTLEITDKQNDTVTSITVEDADANFILTPGKDGIVKVSFDGGDGKLHVVHTNSDGITVFDNVVELSGTLTFDAENNTLTVADGTTLSIDFGEDRNITVAVKGDANLTINADSGKIAFKPGENDGSLAFKVTNGDTTIFDGNLSITGGGFSFDMSTQTLEVDAGTVTTFDLGQGRTFTFSLPNGATDNIYIDDDGKINFTPLDSDPFSIKFANGDTTIFEADVTLEGTVSYNPSTNLLSIDEGTTTTIALANGRTIELTATDEAGVTFAIDDEGKITITPGEDDGKIHFALTEGDTVREFDVELTGAIVFDATNQKIYAKKGTTLTRTIDALDIVESITVTDDEGFTFALDSESGKVTITPEEGDGKLQITQTHDGRTASTELEVSGGSIVFDSTNNSLTVTAGTTATIATENYSVGLTVTDEAGIKFNVNEAGNLVVSAEEGDGELEFTIKSGDTVLRSGSIEFVGSIEIDSEKHIISVTKDSTVTLTQDNRTISITANADASIQISEDSGTFTVTPGDGDGSLDLTITRGDITRNLNVEVSGGSIVLDPATQSLSLTQGTTVTLKQNDGEISITATDDAGVSITSDDEGKITITPGEGDGSLNLTIKQDGEELFNNTLGISGGSFTFDPVNSKILITKGTNITFERDEQIISFTASKDISASYHTDENVLYIDLDDDVQGDISITRNGRTVTGEFVAGGVLSYRAQTGTFGLTGANSSHGDGSDSFAQITLNSSSSTYSVRTETDGETLVFIPKIVDGNFEFNFPNERKDKLIFTFLKDGQTILRNKLAVDGTLGLNTVAQEFYMTEGTSVQTSFGDYSITATANDDAGVKISSADGKITFTAEKDGSLDIVTAVGETELLRNTLEFSAGSAGALNLTTGELSLLKGTKTTLTSGDYSVSISPTEDAGVFLSIIDGKLHLTPGENDGALEIVTKYGGETRLSGTLQISGGSIVLDTTEQAISLTKGTTITLTIDDREVALTANEEAKIAIAGDGNKFTITPGDGDGSLDIVYSVGGQAAFANNVEISGGSITFDALTNSVGLTKGTTITLSNFSGTDGDSVSVTALDDASLAISAADGGLRIAPDSGDGDLQLSVTRDSVTRTATIGIEGAIVYQRGGNISLEEGTTIDLVWEDGYEVALTSRGSSGTIALDAEKGLGITSADDKLDLKLTNPSGVEFTLGGIQGTLWYNSGKALVEEGSTLTTTWTGPAGVDIGVKVSAVDDDAYIKFDSAGMTFASDEGTAEVSFTVSGIENTMSVTGGSITFERTTTSINFVIAEGTTLTTNLVSGFALPFTTTDAGEYTINEHKLTTSTEGVQFYATSNGIILATGDGVTCDGMTFTGDGNVTLTADGGHVIGAGVSVAGFAPDNSIVLTEAGSVTVDGRVFELIEDAPLGVTVTGAEDGFVVGSRESEDDSPFIEKFAAAGDSIYRVQVGDAGLAKVIEISAPVTINGGATKDGKSVGHYFYIGTETEGDFTIGERVYNIAGDSLVTIETNFDGDEGFVSGADGLEGTIRGDFTASPVTVNGGESIIVHGDTDISIAVNENGLEIFNVSDGATLETYAGVSKAHTDGAGDFVLGVEANDSILIRTDDAATFEFDDEEYVTAINGIGLKFANASEVILDSVSAYDDLILIHGAENAILETDKPEKVWMQMTGASMTVNDNELKLAGDKDGIWFSNKEIVGLDEGASLTVGEAGTYSTEVVELDAQAGDVIVGLGGEDAYIYDENNPLITKQSTTEELVARFNPDETFVVGSESRGRINLELDGDDLAIVEDTPAWVNINADGDTIVSQGQHVNVNLGDGNTWLFPLDGNMTLEGYDHSTDTGFGTNYTDIASAIERGSIQLGDGKITLGSAKVDMGGNDLINFYNRDGELQKVGYAAESDALDASDTDDDLLLFAENYSTVNSGSGDDTIKAGAGAVIDAGAGDNFIELATEDDRYEHDKGAVVDINDGDNTVENFKTGFDYESDAVSVETSGLSCFFDGTDITVQTSDGGTTVLEDVADNADFAQIKIVDGTTYNAAIAQEGEFIDVTDDKTDIYIGENSGVDFSGYSGQVLIDLDDKRGTVGKTDAQFFGINQLIGGDGITTLIGSSGDETITAGTGRASIWGNWGNDLMIGNTSADKKGSTEFFMFADDGHDTIDHFEFLTAQNSLTADRIYVGSSDINSATLNGDDVVINFDGSSDLTLTDAAGKNIQISDMIAKVDTDVEFDGIANTYIATDSNAELTVADSVTSAEIWLNNSRDAKFYGDIRTIDASNVSGKTTLGGNDLNNTIIAGQGDASLWGSGGNDWLVGGDGHNTFFYLLGNGNDTITGTNTDDELALSDITLDQISETSVTENGASIKFTDGGSLTINGTADVTAVLADGTHYTANHAQKEWVAR